MNIDINFVDEDSLKVSELLTEAKKKTADVTYLAFFDTLEKNNSGIISLSIQELIDILALIPNKV